MIDTITLVTGYYAAFNAGDDQAFLALLAENVIHDINQGARQFGKPAFADFLRDMRRSYRETVVDLVVMTEASGQRAAAEFTVHGEYLHASPGLPPARGQRYSLPAGAFFLIQNNRIARISNTYNVPDWLAQVT